MRLSINELANLTAFDRRTVSRRLADLPHDAGPKSAKLYDSAAALRLLYAGISEGLDPQQERAALDRVRREIAELELQRKRKDLWVAEDVTRECESISSAIRNAFLSLPFNAAPAVAHLTDLCEVEDALRGPVHEILTALSQFPQQEIETDDDS